MATVQDLASYLIPRAMAPREYVSLPRLIKLMYLADWREALICQSQITNVQWSIGPCGPSSDDIYEQLKKDVGSFVLLDVKDRFGNPKKVVEKAVKDAAICGLTDQQKDAADFIIGIAKNRPWESLTSIVSSTYPVATREPGSVLNLPALAREYQNEILPLLRSRKH